MVGHEGHLYMTKTCCQPRNDLTNMLCTESSVVGRIRPCRHPFGEGKPHLPRCAASPPCLSTLSSFDSREPHRRATAVEVRQAPLRICPLLLFVFVSIYQPGQARKRRCLFLFFSRGQLQRMVSPHEVLSTYRLRSRMTIICITTF